MPTTKTTPHNMSTAKKPASKRKASRRAPGSSKRIEAALQGLQTGLQSRGASESAPSYRTFDEQKCFIALLGARPNAMDARLLAFSLNRPLSVIMKTVQALAARGDILIHEAATDPAEVKWKTPCADRRDSAAAQADAELKGTVGYWVFEGRGWPRYFELPGLAGINKFTADEVIHLLARVIHEWEDELHALAAQHAHNRPNSVAELAEVMAICEQIACAGGLATELDDTPIGGTSPRLLLAALAKQQCQVKRPRSNNPATPMKGGKARP